MVRAASLTSRLVPFLSVALTLASCHRQSPRVAEAEPPVIPVSQPVQRQVTDFVEFTGRTEPVEAVDVRARVTGYIQKIPFKEGSEVQQGDLLFEIDPRPYQALVDQAQSQVTLNNAQLKLAEATYERYKAVDTTLKGAVTAQELDQYRAAVEEAKARINASQAILEAYELNLSFTKVTSPIDGQVSRYFLTAGNLVNQDQTLLTTVVSLDPVYAYFDLDESTLLRVRRAINDGRLKRQQVGHIPVSMGLQGEEGFAHAGTIDFVNNQVNPSTGSISVRGVFANPRPADGSRMISPGMFARIHLPIGQPHTAVLVIDRAIASDQGLKFVYVMDEQHTIHYRRVTLGALQEDGLRVIQQGLKAEEWVVTGGLQQVRPRTTISPEKTTMPSLGHPAHDEASPAGDTQPARKVGSQQRAP